MAPSDAVQIAIALAWLAMAAALLRMQPVESPLTPWLRIGAFFCVTRAADFAFVRTGAIEAMAVIAMLDALVLVLLVSLVLGAQRLRRGLLRQHRGAAHAQAEYSRALLDYTQLVRHRIANPLTAVMGGAQTLLEVDVDEPTRRQLLEAMLSSARRLEEVALHPERISHEEAGLEPWPAPLRDRRAREALAREGGEVESDFRDVNRRLLDALPSGHADAISFVCECSARECAHPIVMTLADYYDSHADSTRFVVAPEHDVPAIEDVVARRPNWWIVQKRGPAANDARRRARSLPFTQRSRQRAHERRRPSSR